MANLRSYPFWGALTEGLRTGQPQNEAKSGGDPFKAIYADPQRLENFLSAMTGVSLGAAMAIAQKFPWKNYKTFIDIGVAQGGLPVQVARAHPHLTGGGFDLEVVRPLFEKYVAGQGLSDRLKFYTGSFFEDPLPSADVLVMGHILHDWNLEEKKMLLRKACDALPAKGALIVYEALIDDDRRENAFGLLMSLNMLARDARRIRLLRRRLSILDARSWLSRNAGGTSYRPRFNGRRNQIVPAFFSETFSSIRRRSDQRDGKSRLGFARRFSRKNATQAKTV